MQNKVWIITGASRGFGRLWAEAALERGDRVAATARSLASVADLRERFGDAVLPLELDVTDPDAAERAVGRAHDHFGRLDVVVNNAAYSLVGTIEEASEADIRAEFETIVFGALRVVRAALPRLRAQRSGHIVGVSSSLGLVAYPLLGYYSASKWAFEALHESLAQEVLDFGIKVTLIEPGAYATEFGTPASVKVADGMDAYADVRKMVIARLADTQQGDPKETAKAILSIVDADHPPLRFLLGSQTLPEVRAAYAQRIAVWEEWESVSNAAQGVAKNPTASS